MAALAAIVIHAVWGMIDVTKLTALWRAHHDEFGLAAGALLGVVVFGIFAGVAIGVAPSFALLIHRIDRPRVALLGRDPSGTRFEDLGAHPDAEAVPGTVVCRIQAPLIFANAETIRDAILATVGVSDRPPDRVVLDLENVPDVDSTGSAALLELQGMLAARGAELILARPTGAVRDLLRRDAVLDGLGEDHVSATVREAVGDGAVDITRSGERIT